MLVLLLVSTFLQNVHGLKITPAVDLAQTDPVLPCIANITRQYFAQAKNMVYLRQNADNNFLKFLHSMEIVSFNVKMINEYFLPYAKNFGSPNLTYVIVVGNLHEFLLHILDLVAEGKWNPYARFLVIIKSLRSEKLHQVFDSLLRHRVYNVVVMNGTITTDLYTYNPFENYACGKYYTRTIYYGKCPDVTADIYPNKVITGLRKCFFEVSIPHWPPYGIDPSKADAREKWKVMGVEHYIFHMISEIEQFKYRPFYDFDSESFSTVSKNMTVSGPMVRLTQNLTDFMLGGLMLIPSRAKLFSFIHGHLDYIDDIRLIVKKAGPTPPWKDIYLEFPPLVWTLILLALLLYSALVTILLKAKDKGRIVLVLMDSLLSHGFKFRSRQSVNCVVIIWVISAYLLNSFYTTNLMSLTMRPSMGYQIRDEKIAIDRGLEPCISFVMGTYLKAEDYHGEIIEDAEIGTIGCKRLIESVKTVGKSDRLFTIVIYSIYSINRQKFCDEYGKSTIHSFVKPYTKVIYAMYYNKGFPMGERLHKLALRIREVGLSEKSLTDQYHARDLKYRFHSRGFEARFAIPWYLYSTGVFLSTITFVVELASQYNKLKSLNK